MTSYLFRNVTIWDGVDDEEYAGEVVVALRSATAALSPLGMTIAR